MWGVHNEFQVPILSSSWKFRVARCTLNYSSAPIGIGNEAAETDSQYPDPRFVAYLNAAQSPTLLQEQIWLKIQTCHYFVSAKQCLWPAAMDVTSLPVSASSCATQRASSKRGPN